MTTSFESIALNFNMEGSESNLTELNKNLFIQLQKVMQENSTLKSENIKLKEYTRIDPLTKMYNRQFMDEYLHEEIERAERYNIKFSMIIVDIDFFKKINDTYGHQVGDKVLKRIAELFKLAVRKSDISFRYGGEEFLIALPETDLSGAYSVANKLRKTIEETVFENIKQQVTVSVGLAERKKNTSIEELIYNVDMALYEAKRNGRNQVRIAA